MIQSRVFELELRPILSNVLTSSSLIRFLLPLSKVLKKSLVDILLECVRSESILLFLSSVTSSRRVERLRTVASGVRATNNSPPFLSPTFLFLSLSQYKPPQGRKPNEFHVLSMIVSSLLSTSESLGTFRFAFDALT